MLLVCLAWGANFVPIRWALDELPPFALSGLRFLAAALPAVFFVARPTLPLRWIVAYGSAVGVFQFGLLFLSIKLGLAAGLASVLMQMQMFFTIALAALFTGDKVRSRQIVGATISFVGLGALASEHMRGGVQAGVLSLVLVLLAAFAWAAGNVIAKAAARRHRFDMFALVVWSSLVAPVPLGLVSFWTEGGPAVVRTVLDASPRAWLCILFMAYAATIFGYGTWNRLLHRHPAGMVVPFTMLVPVTAVAASVLLLGETLGPVQLVGAFIILAGLGVAMTQSRAKPRADLSLVAAIPKAAVQAGEP